MRGNVGGKAGKPAVGFVGSDHDEVGHKRDVKFEGQSNLKRADDRAKAGERKKDKNKKESQIQQEYIAKLQTQVATMESQIKCLKSREVDQKNKASGYETLLRDKIPLNEHFLALKNKFNNEKDGLEKKHKALEDDIMREQASNQSKKDRIEQYTKD